MVSHQGLALLAAHKAPITFYVLRCLGRVNGTAPPLRTEWMSTMLATWLSFEGMLRPGQVERLIISDFCFPEDVELSEGVGLVITIRQAKIRRVWANQFTIVQNRTLVGWLKWWCSSGPALIFFNSAVANGEFYSRMCWRACS